MDVTTQIRQHHITYGSSDNTNPAYNSAGKSLNYANGASIQKPELEHLSVVPYQLNYRDTVGLFGAENHFVKVQMRVKGDVVLRCFEPPGWECAVVFAGGDSDPFYQQAEVDYQNNEGIVNTYEPAIIGENRLPDFGEKAYISVDLSNLKTGNKYNDTWLDVRLYCASREEHPYDKMYIGVNDFFYIGFHARNTRRLPYNVECLVGNEYLRYGEIEDKKLIMKH